MKDLDSNEQDLIIFSPIVETKVKLEVLDPTGIITETHEFEYKAAYWAGRALLTIGEHVYIIGGNGKTVRKISDKQ